MLIVDAQIHLWSQNLPSNAAHRQIASWSAVNALGQIEPGTGKLNPGDVLDVLLLGAPEAA